MGQRFLLALAVVFAYFAWQMIEQKSNNTAIKQMLRVEEHLPSAGSSDSHDPVVAELFDYHCGYCKKFQPALEQLRANDPHVRIVYLDYPVFGGDSILAAKAALAVYSIDPAKYRLYHDALLAYSGVFDEQNLSNAAQAMGIDRDVFLKALADPARQQEIKRNYRIARTIHARGVPTLIIGEQVVPGGLNYDYLRIKVASAREAMK